MAVLIHVSESVFDIAVVVREISIPVMGVFMVVMGIPV